MCVSFSVTQSFQVRFGLWTVPTTRTDHVAFQHTLHRNLAQTPVSPTLKHSPRILNRYCGRSLSLGKREDAGRSGKTKNQSRFASSSFETRVPRRTFPSFPMRARRKSGSQRAARRVRVRARASSRDSLQPLSPKIMHVANVSNGLCKPIDRLEPSDARPDADSGGRFSKARETTLKIQRNSNGISGAGREEAQPHGRAFDL